MADLLPNLLEAHDRPESSKKALRHLTWKLHALGSRLAPHGLQCLHTTSAFDTEQIWSQLTLHSRQVLGRMQKQLHKLEKAKALPPPQSAAPERHAVGTKKASKLSAAASKAAEENTQKEHRKHQKKKARKKQKGAAVEEVTKWARASKDSNTPVIHPKKGGQRAIPQPQTVAGEPPSALNKRRQDEEAPDEDEAAMLDDGMEEGEEGEEESEDGGAGQAFPEGNGKLDDEDQELLQMLQRLETSEKAQRAGKGQSARRGDAAKEEDAEAALTELYGEGAFDPDEDLALYGEGEEDEEDEEEGEEGAASEGMRKGEQGDEDEEAAGEADGSQKESRRMRKLRELQESLGDAADGEGEEEEEEEGDVFKPDVDDSAARPAPTQVDQLEAKLLRAKPWAMQGEAAANQRPTNSLLEDDFAVEHAMKQVPVITPEATQALEDRIRKRIQDKLFDDVYPKVALSTTKDVAAPPLDCVKSSLSLVDLYEKDFLEKKRLAGDSTAAAGGGEGGKLTWEQKEEKRAIELWFVLSRSLDALSHAHYVPNPVLEPDLSVTTTGAALKLEEAIPAAVNTSQLLAPQDTFTAPSNQAGLAFKADEELTREDRRRLRRSRKADNRADNKRQNLREYQQQMALASQRRAEEKKRPATDLEGGVDGDAAEEGGDADEGPKVLPPKHKRSKVGRIHQAKQQEAR